MHLQCALSSLVNMRGSQYANYIFRTRLSAVDHHEYNSASVLTTRKVSTWQVHHKCGQAKHAHVVNSQTISDYPTSF